MTIDLASKQDLEKLNEKLDKARRHVLRGVEQEPWQT